MAGLLLNGLGERAGDEANDLVSVLVTFDTETLVINVFSLFVGLHEKLLFLCHVIGSVEFGAILLFFFFTY